MNVQPSRKEACPPSVIPPSNLETARTALAYTAELHRLQATLPIPSIAFKGPIAAWTLYETPAQRPMSDLDILIHKPDFPKAIAALKAQGYQPSLPEAPQIFHRRNAEFPLAHANGLHIDLHWHLGPEEVQSWFDLEEVWKNSRFIEIAESRSARWGKPISCASPACTGRSTTGRRRTGPTSRRS